MRATILDLRTGDRVVYDRPFIAHPPEACENDPACCIHKPSGHRLSEAPFNWRTDRQLMERVCAHGIGHPDPDDLAHARRSGEEDTGRGIHGCDGCCG